MTGTSENIQTRPSPEEGDQTTELARDIHALLDERKAEDITVIDLRDVNAYFHLFLIATATSQVHLKSLVRDIHKELGHRLPRGEGVVRAEDVGSGWVALDFIDVVVHLFLKEQRGFYNLERLWGDAARLEF